MSPFETPTASAETATTPPSPPLFQPPLRGAGRGGARQRHRRRHACARSPRDETPVMPGKLPVPPNGLPIEHIPILVVEDDEINRRVVGGLLSRMGWKPNEDFFFASVCTLNRNYTFALSGRRLCC